ncbi:MAG: Magnesium-transporting ATPase, P-type 1 [Eubacteriales bacterium SKADARSKE-1]|nr:Magnesium-transporting ATPase, P-type 1 [Eubacteriales bacterium SKADARSKE-1]
MKKDEFFSVHMKKDDGFCKEIATISSGDVLKRLNTSLSGLTEDLVEESRNNYGKNVFTKQKKDSLFKKVWVSFASPFTAILIVLAIVSLFTDVIFAEPNDKNFVTFIIILTIIMISGVLRFVQEARSGRATEKLIAMIENTAAVFRNGNGAKEIPIDEIVVGDIVNLSTGDMVPADVRILSAKDLFISQAAITGESEPIEKTPNIISENKFDSITEYSNLAFMGSNVISGSATCVVIAIGDSTIFGGTVKSLSKGKVDQTSFEKGVNSVSWILIRFMVIMVPIVLFINGFTKGNWLEAVLFSISVALGLTPEMLPMVVTTCLAKGAVSMSKKKTIIKNLNSIQDLGCIDILCTDKTGTLTQNKVVLEYHMDIDGNEDSKVLQYAFLNSYYQTGLKSLMDVSIIQRTKEESKKDKTLLDLTKTYTKVDELPFGFDRRRLSVAVKDKDNETQLITKGAVEEMLSICRYAERKGEVIPLNDDLRAKILKEMDDFNDDGMRVIAVARKSDPSPVGVLSIKDESDMILVGYLAFLDPPKETAKPAIDTLHEYGIKTKILTGDNDRVTRCICNRIDIETDNILLGSDIDSMDDEKLKVAVEEVQIFAKLSPAQKARIVTVLRARGHSVGYMGDGVNDVQAMKAADVGISVDTGVDIAKESADVILLEKDLMVLKEGIIEGRKVYANMIKYIKMTASSNFGNMLSVLLASAFLPFLPMAAIHLILLNLIYDISCTSIPWDNVDKGFLLHPRKWDASSIIKFMLWMGPTSSIFDIITYLLMYFMICPMMCGGLSYNQITDPALQVSFVALFQTGWFIESMWSQSLVIHMIRTAKIPFVQSRASFPVYTLGISGITFLTIIPFTFVGKSIGLTALPSIYFVYLFAIIICYMVLATLVKKLYIKRYIELL